MLVAGNKIYDRCFKCGKLVRLNKGIFGASHFCISDCQYLRKHLGPITTERRGRLWWKTWWRTCEACGATSQVTDAGELRARRRLS